MHKRLRHSSTSPVSARSWTSLKANKHLSLCYITRHSLNSSRKLPRDPTSCTASVIHTRKHLTIAHCTIHLFARNALDMMDMLSMLRDMSLSCGRLRLNGSWMRYTESLTRLRRKLRGWSETLNITDSDQSSWLLRRYLRCSKEPKKWLIRQ